MTVLRFKVALDVGARAVRVLVVAIALTSAGSIVAGCGRLGFEIASSDAGLDAARDAAVEDARTMDVGADVGVGDAGPVDVGVRDTGVDANRDAACAPALDPCVQIPALVAAPVIDGLREECVAMFPVVPQGWTDPGPIPSVAMRAAIAWRPDGLYVYLEVDDPDRHPAVAALEPYCGDGVEIYVDDDGTFGALGAYDDPGTVQLIATAPVTETDTSSRGQQYVYQAATGPWDRSLFAMVGTPTGYALETLVRATELGLPSWTLAAGARVGLNLSLNVSSPDGSTTSGSGDCGSRDGQFFLRVVAPAAPMMCGQPFCDSRAFCTPTLL